MQFCECSSPSSGVPGASSQLHVVETNPFRHLNHLSLKLVSANDLYLKKYLAKCLVQLKVGTKEGPKIVPHLLARDVDCQAH